MTDLIHFLNGKFVSEEELLVSPRDLGFTRGYSVADFIVTHKHKPFKLSEHIDRLYKSAEIIGLHIPWSKDQIMSWAKETLDKNDKATEKTIKILLTGGNSHSMYQAATPTLVMIVSHYSPPPLSYYETGVKAVAVHYKRPYPEAKHTHYVEAVKRLAEARGDGVTEVIYYDDTQVFEGAGCNLFAVVDGKLLTPKTDIIEGITRNVLLEILKLPLSIEVRNFTFDELLKADEIFLTGSGNGIRGVIEISGKIIGNGKVGKITKEVSKQFNDYCSKLID